MAENYQDALRRRLGTIDSMGADATNAVRQQQQARQRQAPEWATNAIGGMGPQMRDGVYNGPRGNGEALRAFGQMLQQRGFRISENSMFNGGHRISSGHVKGSKHYSDRAIDVNRYPGTSAKEQAAIDAIVGLAKNYGLHTIWRQKGHFNHAHFDY